MIQKLSLLLLFLVSALLLNAQDYQSLKKEIDKLVYLDAQIDFERSPAFIVGVIWGDSTFYFSYGSILADSVLLPEKHHQFEIGEVSQLFAAELYFQMASSKQLDSEAAIDHYFEESTAQFPVAGLLNHTSGISKFLPNFGDLETNTQDPYESVNSDQLIDLLKSDIPLQSGAYQFSNLNYGLLGLILEQESNMAYSDLLNYSIIEPLGLQQTSIEPIDSLLITGYDKAHRATDPWKSSALSPALGLKSSVQDLCKFLRFQLETDRHSFLEEKAIETGIRKNTFASWGWHLLQQKRYYPIFVQSGATSGYRAYIAVVPQTKTAVVVLSNSAYGLGGIGFMTLRMLNNYWKRK